MRRLPFRPAMSVVLCATAAVASAQTPSVRSVEVPRPFGHVVGDLVRMNVVVELPGGWRIDDDGLPPLNREDRVIELHSRTVADAPQACAGCVRIELDWQVFKSVRTTEDLVIPEFPIRLRAGGRVESLKVDRQAIAVSPLTAWDRRKDWVETMQSGYEPFRLDVETPARRAALWMFGGMLAGLVWLRLNNLWPFSRSSRPFSVALRALRAHRGATEPERLAAGLKQLHEACNSVAGEAVFADDLPRFFDRFPMLAFAQQDMKRMFDASRARFFSGTPPGVDSRELAALLKRLARAEARMRLHSA